MITTPYSILISNWKITDSVRPLIMVAWHFLMVMKCWIGLYSKKLKRTHPSLSLPPFLSFFNYSLNYIIFLSLCVHNRKERIFYWKLTYLPLYLWKYLLFDSFLSSVQLLRLWLVFLHREGFCEFIYQSLSSSAFSVRTYHKSQSIRRLVLLPGHRLWGKVWYHWKLN